MADETKKQQQAAADLREKILFSDHAADPAAAPTVYISRCRDPGGKICAKPASRAIYLTPYIAYICIKCADSLKSDW